MNTPTPGHLLRLLLIDDERAFLSSLSKLCKMRGIEPRTATTGEGGLAILERAPAHVVVLDVKMPGMGGIETLRQIKKKHPRTEVIFLTGHANTLDGVEGIKAGAFDYLSKPVEFDHLLKKIEQAFERRCMLEEQDRQAAFRAKMERQMLQHERLAALGTMAMGVAHEINNPTAIIHEAADWVRLLLKRKEMARIPLKAELERALEKIESGVERTKRITHQLLGEVKSPGPQAHEINMSELAQETVDAAATEAAKKGIRFRVVSDRGSPVIWSDPYQIRQILINLLTNAVQASSAGDEITLRLMPFPHGIRVSVKDQGQGIPRENLDKIFDPFFSTKSPGNGTGLGLYVARRVVEDLEGTIEVESLYGRGTEFSVRLPRRPGRKGERAGEDRVSDVQIEKGEEMR